MDTRRLKRLPIVQIDFPDHCSATGDNAEAIPCTAFGILYEETDLVYKVCSWVSARTLKDSDSDVYIIVKVPGIRIRKLGLVEAFV